MSKCDICGREPLKANWRSHSNIKTIRRQKLNLQSKKIGGKRVRVCTKCLKTMAKAKIPAKNPTKKTK